MVRLALIFCLAAWAANADDIYTFSLIPASGDIAGAPGSIIGWGYTIQNESSTHWLVTTALNAASFSDATPNAIFDFPDLAPGATATLQFDAATPAGLYELTWNSSAPLGFTNAGDFVLSGAWWDGDPSAGGAFFASAPDEVQPYAATTATPEPATVGVVGIGIFVMAARARRRRISAVSRRAGRP